MLTTGVGIEKAIIIGIGCTLLGDQFPIATHETKSHEVWTNRMVYYHKAIGWSRYRWTLVYKKAIHDPVSPLRSRETITQYKLATAFLYLAGCLSISWLLKL